MRKWILWIVIAVLAGLAIRMLWSGKTEEPVKAAAAPKGPVSVSGIVVSASQAENFVNAAGSLLPFEEVILHPETSGKIVQLLIREGATVTAGQLLLKINDDDLQATRKKLESNLALARQKLGRQEQLLGIEGISQEEYDIGANQVAAIEADLDYNTALIRKTEVRAPFAGRVGLRSVSNGSYVTPATEIASVIQLHPLKLDFSVPERYASELGTGDGVQFEVDGLDTVLNARIIAIEPQIDPATRNVRIRAEVANPRGKLFPGSFARVRLNLGAFSALMIPTQAVIPVLKGKKVFVVRNGKAVSAPVTTGDRNAESIEILSGLNAGDTVVTTGIMQMRDSMAVTVHVP